MAIVGAIVFVLMEVGAVAIPGLPTVGTGLVGAAWTGGLLAGIAGCIVGGVVGGPIAQIIRCSRERWVIVMSGPHNGRVRAILVEAGGIVTTSAL